MAGRPLTTPAAQIVEVFSYGRVSVMAWGAASSMRCQSECTALASEKFVLLKKPLDALRSGDPKQIDQYEDLLSSGLLQLRSQVEAGDKEGMLEEIRTDEKKRKSDRIRLVSNLIRIGVDERAAQRIVDELFSTKRVNAAKREQIISKIAAGDLQNPEKSLIELLKEAKATGVDMATALSSRGRKATKRAAP